MHVSLGFHIFQQGTLLLAEVLFAAFVYSAQPFSFDSTFSMYCEGMADNRQVRQPFNAWSSLFYNHAGLAVIYSGQQYSSLPVPSILYATCLIVLGASSFLFHAALTHWSGLVDFTGMCAVGTFTTVYSVFRILCSPGDYYSNPEERSKFTTRFYIAFFVTFVVSLVTRISVERMSGFDMTLQIVLTQLFVTMGIELLRLVLQESSDLEKSYVALIGVFSFISIGLWMVDNTLKYCFLHGHAIWHLGSALVLILIHELYKLH